MNELDDPREQLRAIRSLMERATIYRALSAPTALIGAVLSFAALGVAWHAAQGGRPGLVPGEFMLLWLAVAALTSISNVYFLWRAAVGRGEDFLSLRMQTALASLAPAFIAAAVLTFIVYQPIDLCILWTLLYGIGLLSTQHFAPRSLVVLGGAFFLTGCVLALTWRPLLLAPAQLQPSALTVSTIMAVVFGGIHLVYAIAVLVRGEERRQVSET